MHKRGLFGEQADRTLSKFMLRELKKACFQLAKTCRVATALRESQWRRQRLLILCYHGISQADEHEWRPTLYMPPTTLQGRLQCLRDGGYTVMPLAEAISRLFGNDLPQRSIVLTFDDGCADFYKVAYPLIRNFGFPVTVYQSTYYSDYQKPVFNLACSYMLWKARDRVLKPDPVLEIKAVAELRTEADRQKVVSGLMAVSAKRNLSGIEKNDLAEILADRLRIDFRGLFADRRLHLMSHAEIGELAAAGIDFELHTHRHRLPQERQGFATEIRENRRRLQELTGEPPRHFCYPLGNYEEQFLPWLAEEGVISAVTCEPDLARAASDALLLPRFVDTSEVDLVQFESWLTGFASFLA